MPRITTSETTKEVVADLERLAKHNRRSAPMQALAFIEDALADDAMERCRREPRRNQAANKKAKP